MTCGAKDGKELKGKEEECGGEVSGRHPALLHPFSPDGIPMNYWVVNRMQECTE